jgi:hypothetical protein
MNNNYLPWIIGAVILLIVGFFLFKQPASPTPASTMSDNTLSGTVAAPADTGTTTGTQSKPLVVTLGASPVATSTAIIAGTVTPNGVPTDYWFEYGTTTLLGSSTKVIALAGGFTTIGASSYLTGLKPNTKYYFKLGAKNSYGTVFGGQATFTTSK